MLTRLLEARRPHKLAAAGHKQRARGQARSGTELQRFGIGVRDNDVETDLGALAGELRDHRNENRQLVRIAHRDDDGFQAHVLAIGGGKSDLEVTCAVQLRTPAEQAGGTVERRARRQVGRGVGDLVVVAVRAAQRKAEQLAFGDRPVADRDQQGRDIAGAHDDLKRSAALLGIGRNTVAAVAHGHGCIEAADIGGRGCPADDADAVDRRRLDRRAGRQTAEREAQGILVQVGDAHRDLHQLARQGDHIAQVLQLRWFVSACYADDEDVVTALACGRVAVAVIQHRDADRVVAAVTGTGRQAEGCAAVAVVTEAGEGWQREAGHFARRRQGQHTALRIERADGEFQCAAAVDVDVFNRHDHGRAV